MSYTYRDLLFDIKKIPEHRLDTLITASNDGGDTYYVVSREEMLEEQEMPPINNNAPIEAESIDSFLDDEAEEPDTPKPEQREREYPELNLGDEYILGDDDFGLEMPPDTEEVLILGPKESDPEPDIELALIVNDSDKTSDAAAAALKKPEDWTAKDILAELDRLNIETKIDGFSLQFKPVKKVPKYLESIIHSRKMEIICQIKIDKNESPSPKSPAQNLEDSIDIEGLLDDGFELKV